MLKQFPRDEHYENLGDYYLVPLWENEKIKGVVIVYVNTWETGGYVRTTDEFRPEFPPFSLEEASKVAAKNLENYDARSLEKVGKLGWKLCEQTHDREFPLWVFEVGDEEYYVDWVGEFYEELTSVHDKLGGGVGNRL
ncbi:hypothetical protein AKJ40_03845 [candidate division MSBL1 archaeon SCGC-AAA259M10]|uniref:Uncharacterized protein n=2 Tax=candidate division MSBL1 TaxID=215777 RepID=A0A133UY96_9EURY|nr:hypothetical protein AKJ36_02920 [candidate division MSBL1 archaeon SCGC-AAA259I07]KXA99154.1 hypothetical protein AKJ40_03845 [candidate division MSBL1 archaeon SCGC-AAA259M10]